MKATQIRAFLVVPALAAVLGLSAHAASADSVTPTGPFTASSTNVSFKLGTATVTCTGSSTSGNAQSSGSGQPISGSISNPTFTGCTVNASGFRFSATCTSNSTNGSWSLSASSGGAAGLTIPQGGVHCTASVLGQNCTADSTPAGSATVSGTWSNTNSSASFSNQSVPVQTSGGFPCPSATSTTFSATYTTNPALTISPN
jgi:hypothetical protein